MLIINTIKELKAEIKKLKQEDFSIGFVPTMGALHKGHISLVETSVNTCDKTIVSIFINPIQFGKNEDLDKYPRSLESDAKICKENNVDIIFAPSVNEIYPSGMQNLSKIIPPKYLTNKLCGLSREGHFEGVATVVAKLFNIVEPDFSFFGQKDAQQLAIIKQMVKDFNFNIEVVSCPIVREADGLAMSSRNTYLSGENREKALSISKALFAIQESYKQEDLDVIKIKDMAIETLHKDLKLEYLEFVDISTLNKVKKLESDTLVSIAVKIENIRLIDNILLE